MKKSKKLISILLCFVIAFSFLIPVEAFGYGSVDANGEIYVSAIGVNGPIYEQTSDVYGKDGLVRFSTNEYTQDELESIFIKADFTENILKGDLLQLDFVIGLGRYRGFDANIVCYTMSGTGERSKTYFSHNLSISPNNEITEGDLNYYYSYSSTNLASNTFHFENSANFSYTGRIIFEITLTNFSYTPNMDLSEYMLAVYLNDFLVSVESPDSGQSKKLLSGLSSIIEFIKNIFTKITELPGAIGSFITSLGDKISGFFTNLTNKLKSWFDNIGDWFTNLSNNIKQWFENVGNWFTELGNKISGFFTNLWNNIANKVDSIINSISDWWQGVCDFFESLFVVPEIRLPFGDYVLLKSFEFNMNSIYAKHTAFSWCIKMMRTAADAVLLLSFLNYSKSKFNEVLKNRRENDG